MKAVGWWALRVLCLQTALGRTILEFQYFGNCRESDINSFYHLENTQYGMVSSEASEFNTTVVFTKNMDAVDLKVKVYKCSSASEADCELFMTVPAADCCWRLSEKGQFYSVFAENAQPPFTCPFKKGSHRVTHARVNVKVVDIMMEENIIYLVKFVFDFHGTYAGCFMARVKKTRLRSRKKKGGS